MQISNIKMVSVSRERGPGKYSHILRTIGEPQTGPLRGLEGAGGHFVLGPQLKRGPEGTKALKFLHLNYINPSCVSAA